MKISPINTYNVQKVKINQNIINSLNKTVNYKQYNINEMNGAYLGKDLISFKSSEFNQTLKDNYFQLPVIATPDAFQLEAGKALFEGKDVLVEAPTGTGKTAIAHYATTNNMTKGKTTFYTTPLKALSNQKLNEFRAVYGDENVGILTGDRRENVDAPIIIMTTEVYRNMALANKYGDKNPLMENLGTVIFDEFHYLGDPERGPVWEESVMYTPKGVQTLELSATIGNPNELADWINNIDGGKVHLVSIPESARHVPLRFNMLDTSAYQSEQKRADNKLKKTGISYETPQDQIDTKPTPSDFKLAIDTLKNKEQLPAIFFVFSRNYSRQLLDYIGQEGQSLTTEDEKTEIENIVEKHKAKGYIGSDLDERALLKGYVIHNAGIIPGQKELVEELFQKKLVKVVFATETLAAGINMPAKTVVISSPYKPTDDVKDTKFEDMSIRALTANEFKQMSGRAGRRGIDEIGYVYTMPTNMVAEQEFLNLEVMSSNPINSKYDPDYGFISGYYENYSDSTELENLFAQSFYAYSPNEIESKEKQEKLLEIADKKSMVLMQRGFLEVDEEGKVSPTILAKMAAKVRGYDAITLVESIASKAFDDISPEALAAIAGGIANPPSPIEKEIVKNQDLSYMFQLDLGSMDSAFNRLYKSVQLSLRKLGKSLEDFSSYQEALQFAQSIEKPEVDEVETAQKLKELKMIKAKGDVITRFEKGISENYSLENIIFAMRKGEPIPTSVLESYLTELDKYTESIKTDDISAYIKWMEVQQSELDNSKVKGNKEKVRVQKQKENIEGKIKKAQNWEYLQHNIYRLISENKQFVKNNNLKYVAQDLRETEALYTQLTAKEKLINGINGLISIEEYGYDHNPTVDGMANGGKIQSLFDVLIDKGLEVYSTEINCDIEGKPRKYGKSATQTLYNWALTNKMNSDSMSNWFELLNSTPEKEADEGTLYRRVIQAADLISQIGEIATVGLKESETETDKAYYSQLKQTASEARNLLIREPATV